MQENQKIEIEHSIEIDTIMYLVLSVIIFGKVFGLVHLPWLHIVGAVVGTFLGALIYAIGEKLIELLRSKRKKIEGGNA